MGDFTFPLMPPTGGEKSVVELSETDDRAICEVEQLQAPFLHLENTLPETVPDGLRQRIIVARQLAVYGHFCHEFHAVSMFWSLSSIEMALKLKFREVNPGPFQLQRGTVQRGISSEAREVPTHLLQTHFADGWRILGMPDFDNSFQGLLIWAFGNKLLPDDLPIASPEIVNSFNNRTWPKLFTERASRDGLIGSNPSVAEMQRCWFGLSEEQRRSYQANSSDVLIQDLPKVCDEFGHPDWNLVSPPRSALGAFELAIDIIGRLWGRIPASMPVNDGPSKQEGRDNMKDPKIDARPVTIYDSVHFSAGERLPERITFTFGANADGMPDERLFDLAETEIIKEILKNPLLSARLLKHLDIQYPNCWILTEMLTSDASRSWPHSKPGDLDIICGRMRDGAPEFDFITCIQVKIRKVKSFDETGDFASGSGTTQAHWTAMMGFDRTLLLHCIVRIPQPLPDGFDPSWNSIVNTDFERAAKSCFGVIRKRFEQDRELYGYAWMGWGQAFGNHWETCGGLSVDLVYPPPHRPALDSAEATKTRTEVVDAVRALLSRHDLGSLPIIVPCKMK
jgi:hypothetical protein